MFEFEFFSNFIANFFGLCFGHFGQFWGFLTLLHVSLLPNFFRLGNYAQEKFDKGAHTLFQICPTRICMISNLFLTQLYISLGIVLAIYDIFGYF